MAAVRGTDSCNHAGIGCMCLMVAAVVVIVVVLVVVKVPTVAGCSALGAALHG